MKLTQIYAFHRPYHHMHQECFNKQNSRCCTCVTYWCSKYEKKTHTNYTSTHLHIKHLISYLDFSTGLNLGKGVGGGVGVDIGLLKEQ